MLIIIRQKSLFKKSRFRLTPHQVAIKFKKVAISKTIYNRQFLFQYANEWQFFRNLILLILKIWHEFFFSQIKLEKFKNFVFEVKSFWISNIFFIAMSQMKCKIRMLHTENALYYENELRKILTFCNKSKWNVPIFHLQILNINLQNKLK